MAAEGWVSISIHDETKEKLDLIAEEEEMTITGVVDSSVGFVFDEFYTESEGSDPQLRPKDGRRPDIERKNPDIEIEL
jgi:hypothetical protein